MAEHSLTFHVDILESQGARAPFISVRMAFFLPVEAFNQTSVGRTLAALAKGLVVGVTPVTLKSSENCLVLVPLTIFVI